MKKKKKIVHYKSQPPNLSSFTACGLWIWHVKLEAEKEVTGNKQAVKCGRCKNTLVFKR